TRGNQTISAPSPDCPRDPLVFLYWTRQELAAGRTPSSGVSMETQLPVQIQRANDPPSSSAPAGDHYLVSYPTRYGTRTADVWIRRDQQRVPVTIRASFPLGSFTAQV